MASSPHLRDSRNNYRIDLVSDVQPSGRLWYAEPDSIEYAKSTEAHDAVIYVHDDGGNVIETREHLVQQRTFDNQTAPHAATRGQVDLV